MKPEDSLATEQESDREQRRRAVEDIRHSIVVEASAGAGKTRTLIDRILRLVFGKDQQEQRLSMSEICAITFTEKAASEMKVRLRQEFEKKLSEKKTPECQLELARKALDDLETAAISTIHSFAVSLLKERPIEAELDPHFSALDDIQSELYFRKIWQPWISRALTERNPILEKALRSGFTLNQFEDLARILRLNWLAIRGLNCESPPSQEQATAEMRDCLNRGKDYSGKAKSASDKLVLSLDKALHWLELPDKEAETLSRPGNIGSAANWVGGKDTVREVQQFLRELVDFQTLYSRLPAQRLLDDIIRWIKDNFIQAEWEARKKADGLLDFDDQLWRAHELLKNPSVRSDFQKQYKTLLVDEFQDTDPIQWEMALLLSSTDTEESDCSKLRPDPGRLFIVGDPKQSIYRFRNADIKTYLKIIKPEQRKFLGLDRVELTTNFRSVPSILHFVDAAFASAMNPEEDPCLYQPKYLAFGGQGHRETDPHSPPVRLLADPGNEEGSKQTVREFVERESKRIAALIDEICGSESWKIQEEAAWRAPQHGDMAILLPVLTHADSLEEALRDRGIPYVLEGGKFYYARSEVSSAITVLRAIANPNDAVALYGSLRSIFFGFSDEDLLKARIDGFSMNYLEPFPSPSPHNHALQDLFGWTDEGLEEANIFGFPIYDRDQVTSSDSLRHALHLLRYLHKHRHEMRASEIFELLLQKTGAREVLAVRGFQSLANLNKLGRTLRALQGEATFAQTVDLLSTVDEEGLAESESRLMEERSDAVRILSIHKAKGLDFPIVFLAGLGLKKQTRSKSLLADPHRKKTFALNAGAKDSVWQTPGWKELSDEEKKMDDAELVRLLYVALTRARDYMILSTHTAKWKWTEETRQWMPDFVGTRLKPLGPFLTDCLLKKNSFASRIDVDALDALPNLQRREHPATGKDWQAIAKREYQDLRALPRSVPSERKLKMAADPAATLNPEDFARQEHPPDAAESRTVRLGIAFHEAMEHIDLNLESDQIENTQELCARHKLDPESARNLEDMLRACLSSKIIERARSALRSGRRVLREFPFVRSRNNIVEEGRIDLLFEEEDGWVLVDYKTDWVSKNRKDVEAFLCNKYAAQIHEYWNALQSLSVKVTAAYLLLARTGAAIKIENQ
jgi:ATP-dependent helicase/nuclease subunit A